MIRLAPFGKADFSRLISWVDSEALLVQFSGPVFTFPLTPEQLEQYISDGNRYAYTVTDVQTNEAIGHAEIYIDANKVAKLCRILIGKPDFRGKGLGQEIVEGLVDLSFGALSAEEVMLNVYDWNIAAIKCYEKAGFVFNPLTYSKIEVKGEIWISNNMILDKSHWEHNRKS